MTVLDRRSFLATTAGAALMTAAPALAQGSEDAKLRTLLDKIFEDQVDDSPERATGAGPRQGRAGGAEEPARRAIGGGARGAAGQGEGPGRGAERH